MDISIVDVSLAADQSGEPRLNLGDVSTGKGFAAGVPMWGAGDGFIGLPNGPDGGTTAPQGLMATVGHNRFAIAVRDPRIVVRAGQLAEGDRAIVSACDVALRLTKVSNKIGFVALPQNMSLTLDAAGGTITASIPNLSLQLAAAGGSLRYNDGAGTVAQVDVQPFSVVVAFSISGVACSITLGPGGTITVVAPGGVLVNGTPLVFSGGAWV